MGTPTGYEEGEIVIMPALPLSCEQWNSDTEVCLELFSLSVHALFMTPIALHASILPLLHPSQMLSTHPTHPKVHTTYIIHTFYIGILLTVPLLHYQEAIG